MVKSSLGAVAQSRESVNHARLRRLGTEGRWNSFQRYFESSEAIPTESKKHADILPC